LKKKTFRPQLFTLLLQLLALLRHFLRWRMQLAILPLNWTFGRP